MRDLNTPQPRYRKVFILAKCSPCSLIGCQDLHICSELVLMTRQCLDSLLQAAECWRIPRRYMHDSSGGRWPSQRNRRITQRVTMIVPHELHSNPKSVTVQATDSPVPERLDSAKCRTVA